MNIKLRDIMALVAVTLALVWCIPSVGQVIKGSISGTVTDPQGAVVANAAVKAKNVDTGIVSTTTSDNSGNFRLNPLPGGTSAAASTPQHAQSPSEAQLTSTRHETTSLAISARTSRQTTGRPTRRY